MHPLPQRIVKSELKSTDQHPQRTLASIAAFLYRAGHALQGELLRNPHRPCALISFSRARIKYQTSSVNGRQGKVVIRYQKATAQPQQKSALGPQSPRTLRSISMQIRTRQVFNEQVSPTLAESASRFPESRPGIPPKEPVNTTQPTIQTLHHTTYTNLMAAARDVRCCPRHSSFPRVLTSNYKMQSTDLRMPGITTLFR